MAQLDINDTEAKVFFVNDELFLIFLIEKVE